MREREREGAYHEGLILKLVSEIEVSHKITTSLVWISPWH